MKTERVRNAFFTCAITFLLVFFLGYMFDLQVNAEDVQGEIEVLINVDAKLMEKYKNAFQKKYPDVTVKYTTYYRYDEEVKQRVESGDYGDVLYVPGFIGEESYWKLLEPLGKVDDLSKKYDFVEKGWVYNNKSYGIPSYVYLTGFIYNTEVFDKAGITELPTTVPEFMSAMQAIKKHTDAIPFCTNCSINWALYPWLAFPYIEMTGKGTYKYDEFVFCERPFSEGETNYEVFKMLYDMVASGYVEPSVMKCDWTTTCRMLNEGKIGCIAMGSWAMDEIIRIGEKGHNIAFMPFPNNVDGTQYLTASVDYSYGISAKSDNKEAARAYVTFMLEESGYALDHENISVFKADLYPKRLAEIGNIVALSEVNDYGKNWKYLQKLSTELSLTDVGEIQRIIMAAEAGTESFEEIMEEWNRRWEKYRTLDMKKSQKDTVQEPVAYDRDFTLSYTELLFVEENPVIKVGYLRHLAPFSMEYEGEYQGACHEICEEIVNKTGLLFEYIGYDNTEEMLAALNQGEIDVAACVEKQAGYSQKVLYSKEYISYTNAMVKKGDFSVDMSDGGKAAAVSKEEKAYWNNLECVEYYDTLAACIDAVEGGKADYTVSNFYSASYYMYENMNKNISIIPLADSNTIHFGFNEQVDDTLVAIINKCIYSIPDTNAQMYVQKYMNAINRDITIKRFIEANPTLCMTIISGVFSVILLLVIMILAEKNRNSRKHAIEMKRYEVLSNLSNEYIFDYELATDQVRFDRKLVEKFSFEEVVSCKNREGYNSQLVHLLDQIELMKTHRDSVIFQMPEKDNTLLWYKMLGFHIEDKNGETIHIMGKLVEVQNEVEEMEKIQSKAETDSLTKLYNRDGFFKRANALELPIMLAVMDLDDFKSVNDLLGHGGGDEALKLLAHNMKCCMGDKAVLARFGGDEFIIAMGNANEKDVRERLNALVNSMNTEMEYEGLRKELSISLGAVYCEQESISVDDMFKQADKELYYVKQNGKKQYRMSSYEA